MNRKTADETMHKLVETADEKKYLSWSFELRLCDKETDDWEIILTVGCSFGKTDASILEKIVPGCAWVVLGSQRVLIW